MYREVYMTEKEDWKQEITTKLLNKYFPIEGRTFAEAETMEIIDALDEALNLADTHHKKVVEGIKEHFKGDIKYLNSVCDNQNIIIDKKREKISRLKAENEKLNKVITDTLGHNHKTCIEKFDEKVEQERQHIIEKIEEMVRPHTIDSMLTSRGKGWNDAVNWILEELKKPLQDKEAKE